LSIFADFGIMLARDSHTRQVVPRSTMSGKTPVGNSPTTTHTKADTQSHYEQMAAFLLAQYRKKQRTRNK